MSFNCLRCLKTFKTKWHLKRHNERKIPCKRIYDKPIISIDKPNISINHKNDKPNISINHNYDKPNISINHKNTKQHTNTKKNNTKVYLCIYCNKEYNHYQSRYRHQKKCINIQKSIKKQENYNKILEKLEKNNKSLILIKQNNEEIIKIRNNDKIKETDIVLSDTNIIQPINNTNTNTNSNNHINNSNVTTNNIIKPINNNNTIHNTININLNAFGKENLNSITKEEKIKTLNEMYLGFQEILKKVHYNIPENNNFFLANKNNQHFITLFNGEEFIYEHSNKFKDKLCNNLMEHLEEWFNEYKNQLLKNKKNMLKKVFHEYYDGKLDDKYNKEIDKYLFSYSDNIKIILKDTIKTVKMKTIEKIQEELKEL